MIQLLLAEIMLLVTKPISGNKKGIAACTALSLHLQQH